MVIATESHSVSISPTCKLACQSLPSGGSSSREMAWRSMKEVECIVNGESKEKVKFVELGNVFFLKARVKAEQSTLGFAQPAR